MFTEVSVDLKKGPLTMKVTPRDSPRRLSTPRYWRIVYLSTGVLFLNGYILGMLSPILATIAEDLDASVIMEGLIGSVALIGLLIGAPIGGWLSDRFGRRVMVTLTLSITLTASLLTLFADNAWWLFCLRLIMGMAIGADYSVVKPLLAEFSPSRIRGRLLALGEMSWYVGFMMAFVVGYVLNNTYSVNWRYIAAVGAVFAVVLLLSRIGMPESPLWLLSRNRRSEAEAIADRYLEEPEQVLHQDNRPTETGSFATLFSPKYRKLTAYTAIFFFCAVTPYFAIATFAADVLTEYGLGDGISGGLAVNGVAVAGIFVAVVLIERVGRRKITIPTQWICAVALAVIGLYTGAPPALVLFCFVLFAFSNAMCSAIAAFSGGEVFPTFIRSIGSGFATAVSRVGAGVGTFLLPWAISNLGTSTTMLIAAAISALGAVVTQAWAPEPRGKSLE